MKDKDWFENLPENWSAQPLKHFAMSFDSGSWGDEAKDNDNDCICLRVADFDYPRLAVNTSKELTIRNYPQDVIDRLCLRKGDILIEKSGGGEKTPVGRTVLFNGSIKAVFANFIERLTVKPEYDNRFIEYCLVAFYGIGGAYNYFNQTTGIQNLNMQHYSNDLYLPNPPIGTQIAISDYLDKRRASIDSAISKHQQIIEKLDEYRKAVITQAVTKGLNPNVEMKDSGDAIIPVVPSHWLWTRVKFTVNVVRGGSPRPIEQYIVGENEDGYNWIKIGDATGGGKFITETKQRIKPDGLSKTRLVHAGTLLLTNSMSFGHPYFLQIDGCIHDGWLAFSDYKGVLPEFLYYYLMSETTAHQFTTTADGSVVQNLNIDKVRNSHIALPPIDEQEAIVHYLNTVDDKINTAIQRHNQIIEGLQEYKQSLIYNAVTGKIDCTAEA